MQNSSSSSASGYSNYPSGGYQQNFSRNLPTQIQGLTSQTQNPWTNILNQYSNMSYPVYGMQNTMPSNTLYYNGGNLNLNNPYDVNQYMNTNGQNSLISLLQSSGYTPNSLQSLITKLGGIS